MINTSTNGIKSEINDRITCVNSILDKFNFNLKNSLNFTKKNILIEIRGINIKLEYYLLEILSCSMDNHKSYAKVRNHQIIIRKLKFYENLYRNILRNLCFISSDWLPLEECIMNSLFLTNNNFR